MCCMSPGAVCCMSSGAVCCMSPQVLCPPSAHTEPIPYRPTVTMRVIMLSSIRSGVLPSLQPKYCSQWGNMQLCNSTVRSALRLWTVNMRCEADVWCLRGRTGLLRRRAKAHSKRSTTCYLRLFQQQTTLSNGAGGDALTSSTLPQMASMSGHIYPDVSHTTRQRNTVR